jgi:hypothetical protein
MTFAVGQRVEFLPGSPPHELGLRVATVVSVGETIAESAARIAPQLGKAPGELLDKFRRAAGFRGAWEKLVRPVVRAEGCAAMPTGAEFPLVLTEWARPTAGGADRN